MSLFACPICGSHMNTSTTGLVCPNGHTFDRAASGYINLLSSNRKHTSVPGDSREMVEARQSFLAKGYYGFLSDRFNGEITKMLKVQNPVFLDAGCGNGYYTRRLFSYLQAAGSEPSIAAVDISKEAVKHAAKHGEGIEYAVASLFAVPMADASVDVVVSIFAPYSAAEFKRLVRPGGYVAAVIPGKKHLFGLKKILYENSYENEEQGYDLPGFTLEHSAHIADHALLPAEDIGNLFRMTPYFWKSPKDGSQRLLSLERLETEFEFVLLFYRRETEINQ